MLPSNLQVGQKANLNFFKSGRIDNVEITAVKFHRGKVYYDVAVDLTDEEDGYTILEGIDSVCVEAVAEVEV